MYVHVRTATKSLSDAFLRTYTLRLATRICIYVPGWVCRTCFWCTESTYGYDLMLILYAVDKIRSCYELGQDAWSRFLQNPIVRALVTKLLMLWTPKFRDRVHGSSSLSPYPGSVRDLRPYFIKPPFNIILSTPGFSRWRLYFRFPNIQRQFK